MQQMFTTFRDLFEAIWAEQSRTWTHKNGNNKPSQRAKDAYERMLMLPEYNNFHDLNSLRLHLPSKDTFGREFGKKWLLLPPMKKAAEFVPLLKMSYNFNADPVAIAFRVVLICLDGTDLRGIGFRMETGDGMHEFIHAQFIRDLGASNVQNQPLCPQWIPDSQPSFPLVAACPVMLVLCLLLSLYGLSEAKRYCKVHSPHKIEEFLSKMEPFVKLR